MKEGETDYNLLVENLSDARDEIVKLKNERRTVSDNDAGKIYTEIIDFKKDMMRQVKVISDLCQEKIKCKTPAKTMKSRQQTSTDERVRNEARCKRKPNQTVSRGCTLR